MPECRVAEVQVFHSQQQMFLLYNQILVKVADSNNVYSLCSTVHAHNKKPQTQFLTKKQEV